MDIALQLWVTAGILRARAVDRYREEVGEGVISTAIAVLIMALLGAAMWVVFNDVFTSANDNTRDNVNQIGS
ncbi:MAG: hypothetical protein WD232_05420 [Acidimicrobiales bacterium]